MADARAILEAQIRAAAEGGDLRLAATVALEGYGGELLGFLAAMTRDEVAASEAFAMFAEDLWKGLPEFRWQCTFRTWAYTLVRHALVRYRRDPFRRRATPIGDATVSALVDHLVTQTPTYLRTETKDKIARLRAELDPDDQTLLILRINRGLNWREIARVIDDEREDAGDPDGPTLERRAAALRKRFERLKTTLKDRASRAP
ncbi:MAG: sigma-70 family RNA polymerase sigma factor [Kofleriaceae bacterium]